MPGVNRLPTLLTERTMTHMPFGKFKGTPLEDLPDQYVIWLLEQDYVKSPLRAALNHLCCTPPNRTPGSEIKPPVARIDTDETTKHYLKTIILEGYKVARERVKDDPARMKLLLEARELLEDACCL
jgi:uncharacterized protein (DUF3820 family)